MLHPDSDYEFLDKNSSNKISIKYSLTKLPVTKNCSTEKSFF